MGVKWQLTTISPHAIFLHTIASPGPLQASILQPSSHAIGLGTAMNTSHALPSSPHEPPYPPQRNTEPKAASYAQPRFPAPIERSKYLSSLCISKVLSRRASATWCELLVFCSPALPYQAVPCQLDHPSVFY